MRSRRRDIPLLLDHFLEKHERRTGKAPKKFSNRAIKVLTENYDWPGNVRELQNLVERLFTITKGDTIYPQSVADFSITKKKFKNMQLKEAVDIFEKQFIGEVLGRVGGSKKEASKILGIHRNTLQKKLND